MIDGTVWPMDYITPQERKDAAYKHIGQALRNKVEEEAKAKRLLESLRYVVSRPQ